MDSILSLLQGYYGYLLIFQVLIVSGLLLALIWLIIKRTLEGGSIQQPEFAAAMATASPSEVHAPVAAVPQNSEDTEKLRKEKEKYQEKIKFLESKLLEYEILQEEIGTLSALKLENEQLREKVLRMKGIPSDDEAEQTSSPSPSKQEHVQSTPAKTPSAESRSEQSPTGLEDLVEEIDSLAKKAKTKNKKAS